MSLEIRKYTNNDVREMVRIWNEVVMDCNAFPQEECISEEEGRIFFESQTYCGVAVDEGTGKVCGLYILHPNNIGRCSHICNASYAVLSSARGWHIGEALVKDSLTMGKELGFRILQFNAVVESNTHARHLYDRLGFTELGTIPGGFRKSGGRYENICLYYHEL